MESGERPTTGTTTCQECEAEFEYTIEYDEFGGRASGYTYAALHAPWRCDACQQRADDNARQEEAERAEERRRERCHDLLCEWRSLDDFGNRLEDATSELAVLGPHNHDAFKTAGMWLDADGRKGCLIILGGVGNGKTYLAACIRNALVAEAVPVFWLNAASYMATVKRGFVSRDHAETAARKATIAETAEVLVIDDLGKVHPGKDVSYTEEQFYAIIDARYRECLPTIVTTEWKSAALIERVGESVVSRLEDGAFVAGIKKPAQAYRRPAS